MPDPVLLVTGASSGIGAAVARRAALEGWRTALAARSVDRLASLAAELGGEGRSQAIPVDVTEWDEVRSMAAAARERFGRIDAVMANAGFGARRGFLAESPEHWKAMVLTNVYGAALTIRATVDDLRETRGHLVLTGSVAGRVRLPGSLYSCTKWAVWAMAEAARKELHGSGVRVTLIAPGFVDTPFFDTPPDWDVLRPDDVAEAVWFALSRPAHMDVNEILMRPTAQDV
jgi:NADP-dependent 3-hydroxy acid dehydrogenase YdfG